MAGWGGHQSLELKKGGQMQENWEKAAFPETRDCSETWRCWRDSLGSSALLRIRLSKSSLIMPDWLHPISLRYCGETMVHQILVLGGWESSLLCLFNPSHKLDNEINAFSRRVRMVQMLFLGLECGVSQRVQKRISKILALRDGSPKSTVRLKIYLAFHSGIKMVPCRILIYVFGLLVHSGTYF